MKEQYTTREVVQLLVNNNNMAMKLLGDNKEFVIEGEEVVCYRRRVMLPNKELNRYSFKYIIDEVS